MKKYFILAIVTLFMISAVLPTVSFGQIDYVPLTPLPGDNPGDPINVTSYLPRIFTILVGFAGILAVLMIVIGGVQYLSTDAITGKSEAKEKILNAVMGLLLAIGAYVILYTINPSALTFDLSRIGYQAPPDVQMPATTTPATMCRRSQGGQQTLVPCSCNNCLIIGSSGASPYDSLPVTSSGRELNTDLANRLIQVNQELKSKNIGWRITEAWPPQYYHQSICHIQGTCVDAALSSPIANSGSGGINTSNFSLSLLVIQINAFFEAANRANLRAEFEVRTQAEADLLIQRGVTGTIRVISQISAPHWSVYLN